MKFSIIKREPAYFFENMHEDLSKFLKDNYKDFDKLAEKTWKPALEIKETKDEYKIRAELPGINKEDIDIEMHENYIAIKGESQKREEKNDENIHMSELRYGKFYRTIQFEHATDPNGSKAEFNNGILKIILKKQEEKMPETKKLSID